MRVENCATIRLKGYLGWELTHHVEDVVETTDPLTLVCVETSESEDGGSV